MTVPNPQEGDHIAFTAHLTNDCYYGATGIITRTTDDGHCAADMEPFTQDHITTCGVIHIIEPPDNWYFANHEITLVRSTPTSHEVW